MVEKILHWIIFSLLISLFPVVLTALLMSIINKNYDLTVLIGHGELYIVTASLIAPFFGDLLLPSKLENNIFPIWRLIIIGSLLIQLMASVGLYAGAIIAQSLNICYNISNIISNSTGLLIGSIFSIIGSIIYKECTKDENC